VTEIPERPWANVEMDSQVLSAFMACPREMKLRLIDHLVPVGGVARGMEKGLMAHKGLQVFYELMREGADYSIRKLAAIQAMQEYYPTLDKLEGEDVDDVFRTFNEYCEYRKNDVFQVVFTERHFRFIAYEDPVLRLRVILTGRIDLGILEYHSAKIIPIDHKSESEHWFYTTLSNQFKIYALACDTNRLWVNRFGFQKSVKIEKKFKREDLTFDAECLLEFKNEILPYYAKQMLIAQGDNFFPPNYTNCVKGHWGCIFSDRYDGGVCNQPKSIREEKLKRYFVVKEWNPADEAV